MPGNFFVLDAPASNDKNCEPAQREPECTYSRLGTDTIIELMAADNTLFRFATAEAINVMAGDVVRFGFDPEKVHIF